MTSFLNNDRIIKLTDELTNHKIFIFDKGTAQSVIDVDDPNDIKAVERFLIYEKEKRLRERKIMD